MYQVSCLEISNMQCGTNFWKLIQKTEKICVLREYIFPHKTFLAMCFYFIFKCRNYILKTRFSQIQTGI